MRTVIQRVESAKVWIDNKIHSQIGKGLLILLGIEDSDNLKDITWLCGKIIRLRIFDDENGVMNKSVTDVKGQLLVVSQFTLHANTKKGNRPSYIKAAKPQVAIPLYEKFITELESLGGESVLTGVFGAQMKLDLINDGPVTIIIDTKNKE